MARVALDQKRAHGSAGGEPARAQGDPQESAATAVADLDPLGVIGCRRDDAAGNTGRPDDIRIGNIAVGARGTTTIVLCMLDPERKRSAAWHLDDAAEKNHHLSRKKPGQVCGM